MFFFILESVFQVILPGEVRAKVEAPILHNREMLVFGSSTRVLKPSGRTILFYDKKSLSFHNHKGIAVGCLTMGLHAFLCTHFSFFYRLRGLVEKKFKCCFYYLKQLCKNINNILI